MSIQVLILAAGQGKRMQAKLPKVLHHLGGKPLLQHVIDTAAAISPQSTPIVVYGHQGELLRQAMGDQVVKWVEQASQLGTAHALLQALPLIAEEDRVLILYGDVPLISAYTLNQLITSTPKDSLGMLTVILDKPKGYGRILRDAKKSVIGIVEEKDASETELKITEVNPGIYFVPGKYLKKWLPQLKNNNKQKEYYLTDIISFAVQDHVRIHTLMPDNNIEILGVNDKVQLSQLERHYQWEMAKKLMEENGVTLLDPTRFDLRGEVHAGKEVIIDINVILAGKVIIGDNCYIGPNTILRDVTLGDHVHVKANSMIEEAEIRSHCHIGPFARIRPGTILDESVHIGNFVEIKKSTIGQESKINHLSYVGDSSVGKKVNIGAGVITCNYDGVHKYQTIIGDKAFIGSNSQLVAPVTIGEGAMIGAGSTIIKDAPAHHLTLARAQQVTVSSRKKEEK
jgi:bifunctional UDP-N-acetylglucosamine pyrophosphorylase/glucosamine-1-phosphate N-acetyltransferase